MPAMLVSIYGFGFVYVGKFNFHSWLYIAVRRGRRSVGRKHKYKMSDKRMRAISDSVQAAAAARMVMHFLSTFSSLDSPT